MAEAFDRVMLEGALRELGRRAHEDIKGLAAAIGLKSAQEAMELVQAFYPRHMIEPKTQFGLEEIFSKLNDKGTALPQA
jgi:hypothetical protein